MSDDEDLNDLAVRTRQLEAHLMRSPEYLLKVGRKVKWLGIALLVVFVLFIAEEIFHLCEPKTDSPLVLGSIDATLLIAFTTGVLLIRTHRCRHRLNERWLNPDARKTLDTLRRENTERHSPGSSANGTT